MRTIRRHVTSSFTVSFMVTLLVFTFVMCLGVVFKITDLLARGVSWRPIAQVLIHAVPPALAFSIPVSALTSSLLVFGRLSADGEIMAMRACGIALWQIMVGPLLVALLMTVVCIFVNNEISPRSHYARRLAVARLGTESALELIDEGRFIHDFPGLTVHVGRRSGARLTDVRVFDERTRGVRREIRAKSGRIVSTTNRADLAVELYDVRVDPFSDDRPGAAFCRRYTVLVRDVLKSRRPRKRQKDLTVGELLDGVRQAVFRYPHLPRDEMRTHRMTLAVELNKRFALAASCFTFVLLGIPLGVKAHRRESSLGVAMSMFLVFSFYLFIIVAESFAQHPMIRADVIVWLPVLISTWLGVILIERSN